MDAKQEAVLSGEGEMSERESKLPSTFSIGSWRVDGDTLSVSNGTATEQLEPRAFSVLRYLAARPGKLVTIDELMEAEWADVVVTPNAVTRVIAQLRKALGDDAKNPKYIQTVARSGYRLVASVDGAPAVGSSAGARAPLAARFGLVALLIAIVAAAVLLLRDPAPQGLSVAVLPFENYTGDAELAYLGEGVAEEVINSLTRVPELRVRARSLSFRFADADQPADEFARELNVGYFVEGSVRQVGAELRIAAQLIDVDTGDHVWSNTVRKTTREVFDAQDEVSRGIAAALADELNLPMPIEADTRHVPDPEAYELYLKGRYVWHRRGTEPMQPAIDSFAEAVKIDPQFARAWAALASAYLSYPSYSPKGYATWQDAEDAARKAQELDATIPEVYGVLGTFANVRLDWVTGQAAYAEAVRLDEESATAHYWYSEHLAQTGQYAESLQHIRRARELDPLYPAPQLDEAFGMMMFGAYERGAAQFARIWGRGLRNLTAWQGYFIGSVLTRDFETARELVETGPLPEQSQALMLHFIDIEAGAGGRAELIEALFGSDRLPIDYRMATWIGSRLGAYEEVIGIYQDRLARGWMVETRPLWGPGTELARHPRFVELLEDLKLIEYWDTVAWGSICRLEESTVVCDARNMTVDALTQLLEGEGV